MYQPTRLDDVITTLKKRYGHQVIRTASQLAPDFKHIATGIGEIDNLLDGGILFGYLNEFTGEPTSGNTTIVHRTTGNLQRQGYEVVYLDLEHCFDPLSGVASGINLSRLLVVHPANLGDALELVREICIQNISCVVIVDAGSTALGKQFNRLELRLAQAQTCVLALTSQPTHQSQVVVAFKRVSWLMHDGNVAGYHVKVMLAKHPTVIRSQITLDIRFESGGTDA